MNVVHTPGLMDTKVDMSVTMYYMCNAMALLPAGFDAFLFVMKYGDTCTKEVVEVIKALRATFGDVFAKEYCIIAVTHGENFEMDKADEDEGSPQTIEEYFKSIRDSPEIQSLLEDCDYRVVMFYNKKPEMREGTVSSQIQLIQNMKHRSHRYDSDKFAESAKARNQYLVNSNLPQLIAAIQEKLSFLQQYLEKALEESDAITDIKILAQAYELLSTIETESKGTSLMDDLKKDVEVIITSLKSLPSNRQESLQALEKLKNLVNIIKNPPSKKLSIFFGLMKIMCKVTGVGLMAATLVNPPLGVVGTAFFAIGKGYEKLYSIEQKLFNEEQMEYYKALSDFEKFGNDVGNGKRPPLPKTE